jgi:type I restriction enzyme S subunit
LYIDTSSITENRLSSVQEFTLKDAPSRAQRKVEDNTIIYSLVRPNLKHYGILEHPAENIIVSTGFVTIDIKDEYKGIIDPHYLYLCITQNHVTNHLHDIACNSVSAYPSISPKDIAELSFIFPSIAEQKMIASVAKAIDKKIYLNESINRNLEAIITDITDYILTNMANDLTRQRIGDIASIKAGGDCPPNFSKEPNRLNTIPIYSNGTENAGIYGYTNKPIITTRSITVAARGTIGFCVRREPNYVPIIRLLAVTPYCTGGDTYLHQILKKIEFEKNGSVQQQLTVPQLSMIQIPYPSATLLAKYEERTRSLVNIINSNLNEIIHLQKQRDELLPLLMNGQVTVTPPAVNCDL